MNYSKLKFEMKRHNVTNLKIAEELDLTASAVQAAIQRQSIKVKHFEVICKLLSMHPGEFFDGDFASPPSADARMVLQSLKEQIELQKELLKLKDEQLKACLQEKGRIVPVH